MMVTGAKRPPVAGVRISGADAVSDYASIEFDPDSVAWRALRGAQPVDQFLPHQPARTIVDRPDLDIGERRRDRTRAAVRVDRAKLAARKQGRGGEQQKGGAQHHATR